MKGVVGSHGGRVTVTHPNTPKKREVLHLPQLISFNLTEVASAPSLYLRDGLIMLPDEKNELSEFQQKIQHTHRKGPPGKP